MSDKIKYTTSSKQQALFEAWLRGGIHIKEKDTYDVLSRIKAKLRIKNLVEQEQYEDARDLAERLKTEIVLSGKTVSRSFRVPFMVYAKLVELALKKKIALNSQIKNLMVQHLDKIAINLSNTNKCIP